MRRVKIPRKLVQYKNIHAFMKCLGIECLGSYENDDHFFMMTDSNLKSLIEDNQSSGLYRFEVIVSYFNRAKNYEEVVAKFREDMEGRVTSLSYEPVTIEEKKFFIGNCIKITGEINWKEEFNTKKIGRKSGYGCGFIKLEKI